MERNYHIDKEKNKREIYKEHSKRKKNNNEF